MSKDLATRLIKVPKITFKSSISFSESNFTSLSLKAVTGETEDKKYVEEKIVGKVKWFNVKAGFGFINR